ncbi:MAG: transglutaminaseTgpA domain-containing protein [Acidobacteriota bacterium]
MPRPTGTAWGLLLLGLALLAAAINTGNNLLYLLFGLLAASLPVSMAGSLLNLVRVQLDVRLPQMPRAGVPFTLDVRVDSRRRRRAARGLRLSVVTDTGEVGPAFVERVEAGEEMRLVLPARVAARGPWRVRGLRLRTTFPLGLLERRRFFPRPHDLLILPAGEGRSSGSPQTEDRVGLTAFSARVSGTEFEGLRRGGEGSDARRVDWKSTARCGVLMVRENRGEGRAWYRLSIRTRRSGDPAAARTLFEKEIRRLAGTGEAALASGGSVHLEVDDAGAKVFHGAGGRPAFLRHLARLAPTDSAGRPLPPQASKPPQAGVVPGAGGTGTHPLRSPAGRVHGQSVLLALAVSLVALLSYGGLGPVAFLALALSLLLVVATGRRLVQGSRIAAALWRLSALAALAYFFVDLFLLHKNPLTASLDLITFITLYSLFNARSVRDDRKILLISMLQIILAAALTTGVSFALPLIVWLLAATHAQVAWTSLPWEKRKRCCPARFASGRSRVRYAGPAVGATASLLAAGMAIFLLVPHLGTGTFAPGAFRQASLSGFSETSRLGDIGRIKLDRSRVMEVSVRGAVPEREDLRWRGLSLNLFDGRSWSRSPGVVQWLTADTQGRFFPEGPASAGPAATARLVRQEIRLEPLPSPVLFAAGSPQIIASEDFFFLARDDSGSLRLRDRPRRRLSYAAVSRLSPREPDRLRRAAGADPARVRRLYLGLPPLDQRVGALARRLTSSAPTRYDAARALERWLSTNLSYSLQVSDAGREDPLAAFLFDGMAAHCEYFATSMVVLARSVGIPARFVAGYLPGEKSRFSHRYTVRQSDAHSWVEVFFPGTGWISFDPTPSEGRDVTDDQGWRGIAADLFGTVARWWDDYVIGIDLNDQARGFLAVQGALETLLSAGWRGEWLTPGTFARVAAGCVLLLAAVFLGRSLVRRSRRGGLDGRQPPRARPLPAFYRRLLAFLSRRDLRRRPGETAAELARRAAEVLPGVAAVRVRDLTDLYYRVRFDGFTTEREVRSLARHLLEDLRRGILATPRPGRW